MTKQHGLPPRQGLYHPTFEHDACGIGMLVDIEGRKSHQTVVDAIAVLQSLTHRGGVGSEPETGDGAGILLQIPHAFFLRAAAAQGVALPGAGEYGVAMMFASPEEPRCRETVAAFCALAREEGLAVLGARTVPTYAGCLGPAAAGVCPNIRQVFLARPPGLDEDAFERRLYVLSHLAHNRIRATGEGGDPYFYLSSLSCRTIVYKGMLLPRQLPAFYLDLKDEELASAIALVHSRFSTNTFPSWERAHPMRHIIHNGEINTIRGNVNWVKAREAALSSPLLGADLARIHPLVNEDGSDSAMLDDFISLLVHAGRPLPEAMMLAIPEPFEGREDMDGDLRAMYEYNACLAEPWDGPAAVAFTNGVLAGATLDRNGLRPARYTLTKGGMLVLASETGVLPIPESEVLKKDRLRPGRMLLIDTAAGRLIEDGELKAAAAAARPYRRWLAQNLLPAGALPPEEGQPGATLATLVEELRQEGGESPRRQAALKRFAALPPGPGENAAPTLLQRQKLFGYTYEDLTLTLAPMAQTGEDPVSAMGTDTPPAVLSNRPQLLYNYFKQLFAQVTNPPIDAIREKVVTSATVQLGAQGNLLQPGPENCRVLQLPSPILAPHQLARIRTLRQAGLRAITLPTLLPAGAAGGLERALADLFFAADEAVAAGYTILILSDLDACESHLPIPALLAVAGLHHHLTRQGTRTRTSLVAETAEAREAHHAALLVGYGANALCPALACETVREQGGGEAEARYCAALGKSIVKIMSKMGISTVRSYHGAQIFEALGVSEAVVNRYFTGTVSRIGGIGLREIEAEARARHAAAFAAPGDEPLEAGGDYKWRKHGEYHLFNPENIFYLQQACRTGNYALFKTFSRQVNLRSAQLKNIRGLLSIVTAEKPLPIHTVEPAASIVRRFKTGAMSYGSISREAHECMAVAMNRLGAKSNTGEGGEDAARFTPGEGGENRCSAIKQVASGRFGVTVHYLSHAQEIQIKMAQGAKPGEGGHLPGKKVYPWIARARHSTPGVELISPPPHHDIYSIEDLAQLIHDLKSANPAARISVKLVSEAGVGTVAVGVAKGLADVIVVSGYNGGTGAAPRTSIRHAGLPWELGVAEAHQTLLMNNLRSRVVLETDGKLLTGRDVVVAALLGAEEFAFATTPLMVMGCDMMRVCNLDTCPVGIATQNPQLRQKFTGKPEYVENLMLFLAQEVREWMARIGVRTFDELVGHVELLREAPSEVNEKAKTVNLASLLYQPTAVSSAGQRHFSRPQNHLLEHSPDWNTLLPLCRPALEEKKPVRFTLPINNTMRTVGCMLSGEIVRRHGEEGLPPGTIHLQFHGSAGQSFGAFAAPGLTLELRGDANDYIGKGLSGGRLAVAPPAGAKYNPAENMAVGNVALYGATAGEAYFCGMAGERFAVRNSGAEAVVEGLGDHGCEYMTGGRVAVLGPVGRNFAAGMSGGVAYVYNPGKTLAARCNTAMVRLTTLPAAQRPVLKAMLQRHREYTGSRLAQTLLDDFDAAVKDFVLVIPSDYARALAAMDEAKKKKLPADEQLLYAFNAVAGGGKKAE